MRIQDPTRKEFHKALVDIFSIQEMELLLGLDFKPIQKIMIPSAHIGQDLLFLKIIEQMENDDRETEFAEATFKMKPLNQPLHQVVYKICNRAATPIPGPIPTPIPQPYPPPESSNKHVQVGDAALSSNEYDYDAYVSFNRVDEKWVHNTLINMLKDKDKDLNICTNEDLTPRGADPKIAAANAMRRSKKLLLVFSPDYLRFGWPQFNANLMQSMSSAEQSERVIPILHKNCETPESLKTFVFSNWLAQTIRAIDMASSMLVERIRGESRTPSNMPVPRQDRNDRPQAARQNLAPSPAQPNIGSAPPIAQRQSPSVSFNQPTIALTRQQIFGPYQTDITAAAWSMNGESIATASKGGTVWIRNTQNSQGNRLILQPQTIRALAWSLDGTKIATAADDNLIRIWNPHDGTLLESFSHPSAGLTALAWSPQGTHLASASADSIVCLWDLRPPTKAAFHTYQHHNPPNSIFKVAALAWSLNGHIASGSMGVAQIWRFPTRLSEIRYDKWIVTLAWSPDSQYLAVSSDQIVTIRTLTGALKQTYKKHRHERVQTPAPIIQSILWSPDSRYVISSGKHTSMHVWDMESGDTVHTYEDSDDMISLAQDHSHIFGLAADSSVYRWNQFR